MVGRVCMVTSVQDEMEDTIMTIPILQMKEVGPPR